MLTSVTAAFLFGYYENNALNCWLVASTEIKMKQENLYSNLSYFNLLIIKSS